MITYEFVAKEPKIVEMELNPAEDYLLACLELKIPYDIMKAEGADNLQKRIIKAVEKMVGDLNRGVG